MKKTYIAPTFTLLSIAPVSFVCSSGVMWSGFGYEGIGFGYEGIGFGGFDYSGIIDPD